MALAIPLADPSSSAAAHLRRICAKRANVFDTPGGFVVGSAYRRDRARVLRRSANRRWVHVRVIGGPGAVGWVKSGALCRA